ncbi:MAG: DUF2569 family protein [Paralcaligenes sp.]
MSRSANKKNRSGATSLSGYNGWLIVLSAFLLFWTAQELAEFYRVKAQIEALVPSALGNPKYHEYMRYAMGLAWCEALLLIASALLLIKSRATRTIKAIVVMLWVAGPLSAGAELIMANSYFGEYIIEQDYSALAATSLFAITWTCYLLTSRRVKNTYGAGLRA